MAELKDKIQNALDEGRMLLLGSQVLLGFQFRSAFESGFERLPISSQYLKLSGLGLMLLALGLLLAPGAFHRIVEEGRDTEAQHRFTTRVMDLALLPFATALGLDVYVAFGGTLSRGPAVAAGLGASLMALFFWYALEIKRRGERKPSIREEQEMEAKKESSGQGGSKLKDRIKHVLTEARVVLPGAQALLGFQFISTLTDAFEKLPLSSRYVHLASLSLVALSIILLMTPAAYHRIVERGEETEHFHRFAGRMLIAAMVPLALGVCGDFYIIARKITGSASGALAAAAVMLTFFYGLWFCYTAYRRGRRPQPSRESSGRKGTEFAS